MGEPTPAAVHAPRPDRRTLTRWLVRMTRPVLAPLAASTAFRLIDLLAGLALFAMGMTGVLRLGHNDGLSLGGLALTLVVLSLVKAVSRYLEQFLGHLVAFRALELLRREVFARLWPQAPAVVSRSRSGDLLERSTKDVDRLEVFFAHTLAPVITAVAAPAIATVVVGRIVGWPVAGVMALGLAITLTLVPWWGARDAQRSAVRMAELRGSLTHSVTDSVQGLAEVTGYGLQADRLARASGLADAITEVGDTVARVTAVRRAAAMVVALASVLAMVAVGVRSGTDVALLAAAVVVALRCFDITKAVEDFLADLDASFASARRLWILTRTPPAVADPAHPAALPDGPLDVAWDAVGFTYPHQGEGDHEPALRAVSATAAASAHTCIVGASGAGKSTLAHLALRWFDPDAGAVRLGGVDLRDLRLADLREAVTYVSQRPFLFADTVAANLRLARPDATDEDLRTACRQARIADHIESLPAGWVTPLGELAGRWSGGQRARLALARALVTRARVFVVDEYTAHLDGGLAAEVSASLRAARPDATLIEITHRVESSLAADHVLVLENGRCVQSGRPGDLAATPGPFARLLAREREAVPADAG